MLETVNIEPLCKWSSFILDNNGMLGWHPNVLFFCLVGTCHVHVDINRKAEYET